MDIVTYQSKGGPLSKDEMDQNLTAIQQAYDGLSALAARITPQKTVVVTNSDNIMLPDFLEAAGLPPEITVDDIQILMIAGSDDRVCRILSIQPDSWTISRPVVSVEIIYRLNP